MDYYEFVKRKEQKQSEINIPKVRSMILNERNIS
jgi:hypothetical protein